MTQQQREAIAGMLRASPFNPAGDLGEQRPLFEKMVTAAPVPADVVTTPSSWAACRSSASDDAMTAYRALLEGGQDVTRVAFAGESAGANLAVVTLAAIGREGLPQPTSAVLLSPWADLAGTGDSIKTKADVDPVITAAAIRVRAHDYLNGAGARDPAVSPVYGSLAGLPPLLIQAGSHEILLDDAIRLAARAAYDDVAVALDVVPGVPHVFQAFSALLDEGEAALTRAGGFLCEHLAMAAAETAGRQG